MKAQERVLNDALNAINYALTTGEVSGQAADALESAQREIIAVLA